MEFKQEPHRIYMENEEGNMIAEITFPETKPGVYNIDHTFVDESLRGQGIASTLVEQAVASIEDQGGKMMATCVYAAL